MASVNDLAGPRAYDVMTDRHEYTFDILQLRINCLREAVATAKAGLAHDVLSQADRYLNWAMGQPIPDENAGLTFTQRLDKLVAEFLRSEQSDPAKIRHDLGEFLKVFEIRHGLSILKDSPTSTGG